MASLAVNIPTCKWAQRKECVFVTVDIADAKDEEIVIADDKLTFKAMSNGKPYECEMTLHASISMDGSKYTVKGRNVQFYLEKTDQEADFWPRLLKDKALNKRFVKVDFDKWVDEDEEDEADAIDANGMQGMGGMPGMGGPGMGGMPGMGGPGGGAGGMDMAALQKMMAGMGGAGGAGGPGGGMDMAKMMASMGGGAGGAGGMPDMSAMMGGGDDEPDSDDDLDDLDDMPDLEEENDA